MILFSYNVVKKVFDKITDLSPVAYDLLLRYDMVLILDGNSEHIAQA